MQSLKLEGGDALWLAVERGDAGQRWVLDTVVERKRVDDLVASIKSGRYEKQKYLLRRSGLRRLMYLVEGDIDAEPSASVRAIVWLICFTLGCIAVCCSVCTSTYRHNTLSIATLKF